MTLNAPDDDAAVTADDSLPNRNDISLYRRIIRDVDLRLRPLSGSVDRAVSWNMRRVRRARWSLLGIFAGAQNCARNLAETSIIRQEFSLTGEARHALA
jgi:hypothetical protein